MIVTVILTLALLSGGITSAVNAADVKKDYIDVCDDAFDRLYQYRFHDDYDYVFDLLTEICDNFEQIRDFQAATAVSDF